MIQTLKPHRTSENTVIAYHNRPWEQFKHIQKGLEGSPDVRLSFHEGVVEIFMAGQPHAIQTFREAILQG